MTPARATPPACDIALARILQNRVPDLSAADPVELARMVPEVLAGFKVVGRSRLRSPTPKPMVTMADGHEEVLQ